MNNKKLFVAVLMLLMTVCAYAQNGSKGLIAVFITSDKGASYYEKLLQSTMEEELIVSGYSIVAHDEAYLKAVQDYNEYLRNSAVSPYVFSKTKAEKLADYMCTMHIMVLGDGTHRVYATITEYGQTDSKNKKSYPGIKDGSLDLSTYTQLKSRITVLELLKKMDKTKPEQEKRLEESKSELEKKKTNPHVNAVVASTFVPGAGQFYKHDYKGGSAFLVSELALVGGGTACYFFKQKQQKIIDSEFSLQDEINTARKTKNVCNIAMWSCFGLAAAVHIGNMIQAWYAPINNYKLLSVNIVPVVIPTNDFLQPSYAMGAGVQIKF